MNIPGYLTILIYLVVLIALVKPLGTLHGKGLPG